jgi:hypothetical protein
MHLPTSASAQPARRVPRLANLSLFLGIVPVAICLIESRLAAVSGNEMPVAPSLAIVFWLMLAVSVVSGLVALSAGRARTGVVLRGCAALAIAGLSVGNVLPNLLRVRDGAYVQNDTKPAKANTAALSTDSARIASH